MAKANSSVVWFAAFVAVVPSCSKAERSAPMAPSPVVATGAPMEEAAASGARAGQNAKSSSDRPVAGEAIVRRIIHTAELWLETESADAAAKQVTALATQKGGFVVSSDISRYQSEGGAETTSVTIVLRVPAQTFEVTLEDLRKLATHVANEKVSGQDVTEEYMDLEARLRAQRAVEEQYLQILKQAKTIHDTLEVQQKLGEIRGEIERAEGRRRYLESMTSLSTITVHLAKTLPAVDVSGPGFGRSLRRAGRDLVENTIGIINGTIRFVGAVLPAVVLIILPAFFVLRFWIRRRRQKAGK